MIPEFKGSLCVAEALNPLTAVPFLLKIIPYIVDP
jgi:hypothetical protein